MMLRGVWGRLSGFLCLFVCFLCVGARRPVVFRTGVPLDSIELSDPFVLTDSVRGLYFMTGTGGMMWRSRDLALWDGPLWVVQTDSLSWMGERPIIWAAELHRVEGSYYYFATFTNPSVKIDTVGGRVLDRRATHVLRADVPEGPYRLMNDELFLPKDWSTLDGTLWIEPDGRRYMVFCHEWLQTGDGTVEMVELKRDLTGSKGQSKVLFRASDSPWSREFDAAGGVVQGSVTDGPFVFRTVSGRLGMLWSSWVCDVYHQGLVYSVSGRLEGPWVHDDLPLSMPDYGHGMLFRDLSGRLLMAVHQCRKDGNGRGFRVPCFFSVDLGGDCLSVGERFVP